MSDLGGSGIVLASNSASRKAMLEAAGIAFEAEGAAVDERALEAEMEGAEPAEIAQALAAAKAETLNEMAAASATVHALVHVEMPLHVETCARQGIDRATLEATAEAPGNLAYTRYVLEAGYSGDFLDLMAALAPCVLGYGEIGLSLRGNDGPYADWCAVYGGKDYQALCRDVGALIDLSLIHI